MQQNIIGLQENSGRAEDKIRTLNDLEIHIEGSFSRTCGAD